MIPWRIFNPFGMVCLSAELENDKNHHSCVLLFLSHRVNFNVQRTNWNRLSFAGYRETIIISRLFYALFVFHFYKLVWTTINIVGPCPAAELSNGSAGMQSKCARENWPWSTCGRGPIQITQCGLKMSKKVPCESNLFRIYYICGASPQPRDISRRTFAV